MSWHKLETGTLGCLMNGYFFFMRVTFEQWYHYKIKYITFLSLYNYMILVNLCDQWTSSRWRFKVQSLSMSVDVSSGISRCGLILFLFSSRTETIKTHRSLLFFKLCWCLTTMEYHIRFVISKLNQQISKIYIFKQFHHYY